MTQKCRRVYSALDACVACHTTNAIIIALLRDGRLGYLECDRASVPFPLTPNVILTSIELR